MCKDDVVLAVFLVSIAFLFFIGLITNSIDTKNHNECVKVAKTVELAKECI